MAAELVSVVIPCFNAADHVATAIGSALAQRVPGQIDVEVIVVDDASTDDSATVVASLAEAERSAVRLIRQSRNSGPAAARNAGLHAARGDYVCFLDADDQYAPLTFMRCAALLRQRLTLAAIFTGIELVNCTRPVHPAQLAAVVRSLPGNAVVRRPVALLLGGFPEDAAYRGRSSGEDVAFKLALFDEFNVLSIADPCLRYFVRTDSHFDYFLDRSIVVDGRVVLTEKTPEAASGAMAAARERYRAALRDRLAKATSETVQWRRAVLQPEAVLTARAPNR